MDREEAQLFKIMLLGFTVIILYLLWAGFTEAANNPGSGYLSAPGLAALAAWLG